MRHPFVLFVCATAALPASADQMYGVMFRTGSQTSGLNPILFDVNSTTGAATNGRNINVNDCVGIAIDPFTGVMYGLTDQFGRINNQSGTGGKNLLFTINKSTGAATSVGRIDPSGVFQEFEGDIAFNPVTGALWGVSTSQNAAAFFTINKSSGLATQAWQFAQSNIDISAMAFDAQGQLYILNTRYPTNPGPAVLYRLDAATGSVLQSWTTTVALGNVAGMTFGPGGQLFIADGDTSGTNNLYKFNFTTGNVDLVGATGAAGGAYQGLAGLAYEVPAPGTLALILPAVAAMRRRRA